MRAAAGGGNAHEQAAAASGPRPGAPGGGRQQQQQQAAGGAQQQQQHRGGGGGAGSHQPAAAGNTAPPAAATANFEYDDNEWDIGIGDLIIDLDADIEKTNEHQQTTASNPTAAAMAATGGGGQGGGAGGAPPNGPPSKGGGGGANGAGGGGGAAAGAGKMHVEHSATAADKGLKMKIKRTKPGGKASEAKHEIVKSNEQNGTVDQVEGKGMPLGGGKHSSAGGATPPGGVPTSGNKRGSSGHRRDKAREKHSSGSSSGSTSSGSGGGPQQQQQQAAAAANSAAANNAAAAAQAAAAQAAGAAANADKQVGQQPSKLTGGGPGCIPPTPDSANGLLRGGAAGGAPRPPFPAATGPGPPQCGPPSPPTKQDAKASGARAASADETGGASPPPGKKLKTEPKEVTDVCVGTSVGTITEPDCLGPCEPGTSVTLEGIVWHETEGGMLVVNVTWRGKTYVGTLLDCTRHDWAPPRFCDSPTSDLDNRTPKGRETRSSAHSKLRNGGSAAGAGGVKGRRPAAGAAPSSPAPFTPPRADGAKRKSRAGEDDAAAAAAAATPAKRGRPSSPPPSPVLLECPEPHCSKKYKNPNGLKYHQSHAHGAGGTEDEDTKDGASMSENDESNAEAPSPEKAPAEATEAPQSPSTAPTIPAVSEVSTPVVNTPVSAPPTSGSPTMPLEPKAPVVKPGVLRYSSQDEYSSGVFAAGGKPPVQAPPMVGSTPIMPSRNPPPSQPPPEQPSPQNDVMLYPPFPVHLPQLISQQQVNLPSPQFLQPPTLIIPGQGTQQPNPNNITSNHQQQQQQQQLSPHPPVSPSPTAKLTQFKVKPTSVLMPDEKKQQVAAQQQQPVHIGQPPQQQQQNGGALLPKLPQSFKKKSRKSPAGSPLPTQPDQPIFGGVEQTPGRDEVQSPAYSDISDDGAPVMDTDADKSKGADKKTETSQPLPHMSQYGIYPFYSQPHPYMVSSQATPDQGKPKESEKQADKPQSEKDGKKDGPEYPPKVLQQHYYPYVPPGYPYNMDTNYGGVPMVQEDKHKDDGRIKESPSPIEQAVKQAPPIPNPIQVPMPGKVKTEPNQKDKHQNDNHQIIKESIELKNQMNPYLYSRPQQQPPPPPQQQQAQQQQHHSQREEDARRFYMYSEQRRKEQQHQQHQQQQQQQQGPPEHKSSTPSKGGMPPSPSVKSKEVKREDDKKDKEPKQEGVKPTMETQGPPPPPTSQYAYIHQHPGYMQSPHYGTLPFDPTHPVYRGLVVPGPYGGGPYLHATQLPRYHAPEDLSRAPPPPKALDMLQHHAQYYSSAHKIHELQERAIKSPTPKAPAQRASPSPATQGGGQGGGGPPSGPPPTSLGAPPSSQAGGGPPPGAGKQAGGGEAGGGGAPGKDSRSPPPQRHVHTHHHTHVGLGYPMYPAPYGAAVLASQQAAAVTVINPYPTK